ncbi:MAG: arginine N-succinyltransferase [Gammaproteobacteria bacterium]|nr:arginine N-succinyltransferase [Gammaproteobacteria bacterium]
MTRRFSGWQIAFFILLVIVIAGFFTYRSLFPSAFRPVELSEREQARLDAKLESLPGGGGRSARLEPEPYRENAASREINFTERELNSLLASSPEMAERFAIDLSNNLASAKLLVDVPPDFPFLAGKTIAINAGLELSYERGQPIVVLRGVSVWGVPIPSAWLGGLRNVDLVQEFGGGQGFWSAFSDGVDSIQVTDGELQIVLKE